MATVNLYVTSDDNNVLGKGKEPKGSPGCEILNTDIIHPRIKLDKKYMGCNYCQIPSYGSRYYFVTSVEALAGQHCILNCTVDVLETYGGSLGPQMIYRNADESLWNKEIPDDKVPIKNECKDSQTYDANDVIGGNYFIVGII